MRDLMKRWLLALAWLHIMGGLLLPLISQWSVTMEWVSGLLLANTIAAEGSAFWMGVFGPTVASWGALFLIVIQHYFEQPSWSLWRQIVIAILLWVLVDTLFCSALGVWGAVPLNVSVLIALLGPLWVLRPQEASHE